MDTPFDDAWFQQVAGQAIQAACLAASLRRPRAGPRSLVPPSTGNQFLVLGGAPPEDEAGATPARREASQVEVDLLLADDATLQELNGQYRGLDGPTDVLSFPQLEGAMLPGAALAGRTLHLGDVAISVERARQQAGSGGRTLARELGYLLVHGMLHLLGYDHETDDDQAAMRRLEEVALTAAGLPQEAT